MDDHVVKVRRFVDLLVESGRVRPEEVHGCTEADILAMEAHAGPLPAAYVSFLRLAGQGAGSFWAGSDAFLPQLLELDVSDLEELAADLDVELPLSPKLVIFSHQGYEMLWLSDPGESSDPPVWQLLEGPPARITLLAGSFTELLLNSV